LILPNLGLSVWLLLLSKITSRLLSATAATPVQKHIASLPACGHTIAKPQLVIERFSCCHALDPQQRRHYRSVAPHPYLLRTSFLVLLLVYCLFGLCFLQQVGFVGNTTASSYENKIIGQIRSIVAASFAFTAAWYCMSNAATVFAFSSEDAFALIGAINVVAMNPISNSWPIAI